MKKIALLIVLVLAAACAAQGEDHPDGEEILRKV